MAHGQPRRAAAPWEQGLEDTWRLDPGEGGRGRRPFTDHTGPLHGPLPHARPRGPRDDGDVRGHVRKPRSPHAISTAARSTTPNPFGDAACRCGGTGQSRAPSIHRRWDSSKSRVFSTTTYLREVTHGPTSSASTRSCDTGHHGPRGATPTAARGASAASLVPGHRPQGRAAKLDAVFWPTVRPGGDRPTAPQPVRADHAPHGVATATERIGLIATASTTFHEPYSPWPGSSRPSTRCRVAAPAGTSSPPGAGPAQLRPGRRAGDRGALRPRPGVRRRRLPALGQLGRTTPSSSTARADLRRRGQRCPIDHVGRFLKVRGPVRCATAAAGRGRSTSGGLLQRAAPSPPATPGDLHRAHQTLADAQAFYRDKTKAQGFGRDADHVRSCPASAPSWPTPQPGGGLYRSFNELTVPGTGCRRSRAWPASRCATSTSTAGPGRGPSAAPASVLDNNRSRLQVVANIVERDRPTLRELLHRLAGGRGGTTSCTGGPCRWRTPSDLVHRGRGGRLQRDAAALPAALDTFVEQVVPDPPGARSVPHRVRRQHAASTACPP